METLKLFYMLCDLLDCYVSTINCTSGANLGPSMKVSYDSYIDRFALCPKIILILHMNAEQGVHFLLTSFSPPALSRRSWSLLFSALQSHTGTLLSIQPYADCGSREVGRGQGRWTATCLATLLKTLLFPRLHKPPSRSSPASLVRPASERRSQPERTSPERDAWKRNTKPGEIRQKARSKTSL